MFLRPHPKLDHPTFSWIVSPDCCPPSIGRLPLLSVPYLREEGKGVPNVDSWIPLSTRFTWSFSSLPVHVVTACDKPFGSLKSLTLQLQCCIPWSKLSLRAIEVMHLRSWNKVSHCAKPTWGTQMQMMTMPWDPCRWTHREKLPISFKLHNG